jgi:hypothetical protein
MEPERRLFLSAPLSGPRAQHFSSVVCGHSWLHRAVESDAYCGSVPPALPLALPGRAGRTCGACVRTRSPVGGVLPLLAPCRRKDGKWQLAGGARGRGPPHGRNSARAAPASPEESRKRPLLTAHALFLSGRPHSNGPIRGPVRLDPHRAVPNLACTGPGGARAPGNNVRRAPSTAEPSSKHRKFDEHVFSTFV